MFEETTVLPLDRIIPYDKNPRLNDEAVPLIYNSIKTFGYISKIVVNQDGVILSGHTRLKALKRLHEDGEFERGYLKQQGITADAIPVKVVHFKDEKEEIAYRLADNKTAEKAGWDFDLLDVNMAEIEGDFDLADFGFDFDLWSGDGGGDAVDEDEVVGKDKGIPGKKTEPLGVYDPPSTVSAGDETSLGPHTVVCGYPERERLETLAVGRRTFAVASSGGRLFADDVREGVLENAAFVIGDMDDKGERYAGDLFNMGWAVSGFLQWEGSMDQGEQDPEVLRHSLTTVVVVGGASPDLSVLGDGVCREPTLADLFGWLVRAYTVEGDLVIDLTGAQRDMIGICDGLGRACVSFCPDPAACDCIISNYQESHPDWKPES